MTTNLVLPTGTSEPGTPSSLTEREPVITANALVGLVTMIAGIAGWRITDDTAVLLGTTGVLVLGVFSTIFARSKATSPASLKLLKLTGQTAGPTSNDQVLLQVAELATELSKLSVAIHQASPVPATLQSTYDDQGVPSYPLDQPPADYSTDVQADTVVEERYNPETGAVERV